MKQYISKQQFNTLPTKAQKGLKQWTLDKDYAIESAFYGYQFEPEDDGKIWTPYPSLSIGQLIEFLVDRKKDIHIERYDGGKKYSHWSISTCFDDRWKFGKEYKELCDSLWEAVKKELGIFVKQSE